MQYLNLFRANDRLLVQTHNTIPTAAGFASSASGFAALAKGLDALYGWSLPLSSLSILARLGSGSACRSVYDGLVQWNMGTSAEGMDSYAEPLDRQWPELRIGLLVLTDEQKPIGSREAMQHTVDTSPLYAAWPDVVGHDLALMKWAIQERDFGVLGKAAEGNAMAMHATMQAARPSVIYWTGQSVDVLKEVTRIRASGLDLYCTMDAGPNVKLIFLAEAEDEVRALFPKVLVADAFHGAASTPSA